MNLKENSGAVYCIESRPREQGRFTIVEYTGADVREILPAQYSAHATVQELGGGSFGISLGGDIIFSDDSTQNIYRIDASSGDTSLVLKAEQGTRYAGFCVHPVQHELILAIKEDHREATAYTQAQDVHNTLVCIDCRSQTEKIVAAGDDFYAYPRFSPDGRRVCWLQWSHPDMPWTGTVLYVADWIEGAVQNITRVAGQSQKESVSQPKWAPDGTLFFVSDRSGYWQIYSYSAETKTADWIPIKGLEASEFAIADWLLGR